MSKCCRICLGWFLCSKVDFGLVDEWAEWSYQLQGHREFVGSKRKGADNEKWMAAPLFELLGPAELKEPKLAPLFANLDWDWEDDEVGLAAEVRRLNHRGSPCQMHAARPFFIPCHKPWRCFLAAEVAISAGVSHSSRRAGAVHSSKCVS